jgi:cell division protein FtsB
MFAKIKNRYQHFSLRNLRDVRVYGLVVFLVVVLLVTWSGVKAIQTNYGIQKQISQLQQEVAVQQLKNTDAQLENEYYNTNQYLELSARENFGLAAPGETELIVPENVALAHLVNLPNLVSTTPSVVEQQPQWQQNFQSWINFFLHRQTNGN